MKINQSVRFYFKSGNPNPVPGYVLIHVFDSDLVSRGEGGLGFRLVGAGVTEHEPQAVVSSKSSGKSKPYKAYAVIKVLDLEGEPEKLNTW